MGRGRKLRHQLPRHGNGCQERSSLIRRCCGTQLKSTRFLGVLMATEYLPFNSGQAGKQQSADWWVRVLGRPKLPTEISEFLCEIISNPNKPVQNFAVLNDWVKATIFPLLTQQEMNFVNANKKPESDPNVQECLAAFYPPQQP